MDIVMMYVIPALIVILLFLGLVYCVIRIIKAIIRLLK